MHLGIGIEVEELAGGNLAAGISARVDGFLEEAIIPPGHEVAMVAVAREIAVRKCELSILTLERCRVPDGFVEKAWHARREPRWAITAVDERGVGHVRLMVRCCGVVTVPARWKEELKTNTVWAVAVEEVLGG